MQPQYLVSVILRSIAQLQPSTEKKIIKKNNLHVNFSDQGVVTVSSLSFLLEMSSTLHGSNIIAYHDVQMSQSVPVFEVV